MATKNWIGFPHVVESEQFSREVLEEIFALAALMEKGDFEPFKSPKRMISFFYEPSTRTRASFEIAMDLLGGRVVFSTENAKEFSSVAKGESLADTIRVLCRYKPDVIVLRHHEDQGAAEAAGVSTCPIINAGSGKAEHPTQMMGDLCTIQKRLGSIDGLEIGLMGDLKNSRVVRSLAKALCRFPGVKIHFISPPAFGIGEDVKHRLNNHRVPFTETADLQSVSSKVNALYQTRIQTEREDEPEKLEAFLNGDFHITKDVMSSMRKDAIVMHPLPRVKEITTDVDADPRAVYLKEQIDNCLYVRMAQLHMILAS